MSRNDAPPVPDATLHIYGAPFWHADVHIAGTRSALEEIRRVLTEALERPGTPAVSRTVFPSDGEGFQVLVVAGDEAAFDGLPDHYFDDDCGPWTDDERTAFLNLFTVPQVAA